MEKCHSRKNVSKNTKAKRQSRITAFSRQPRTSHSHEAKHFRGNPVKATVTNHSLSQVKPVTKQPTRGSPGITAVTKYSFSEATCEKSQLRSKSFPRQPRKSNSHEAQLFRGNPGKNTITKHSLSNATQKKTLSRSTAFPMQPRKNYHHEAQPFRGNPG